MRVVFLFKPTDLRDADQLVRWKDQESKNWQFGDEQAFKSVGLNTKVDDATLMQSIDLLSESQGDLYTCIHCNIVTVSLDRLDFILTVDAIADILT